MYKAGKASLKPGNFVTHILIVFESIYIQIYTPTKLSTANSYFSLFIFFNKKQNSK